MKIQKRKWNYTSINQLKISKTIILWLIRKSQKCFKMEKKLKNFKNN